MQDSPPPPSVDPLSAAAALAEGLPSIYLDAARHDLLAQMTAPADLDFWRSLAAARGGPILELGAGTGRVTLALAEAGFEVTGLDRSLPLLEWAAARASERGLTPTLVVADMRDFDLGRRFPLVVAPYNVFHHLLDLASIRAFFAAVGRHLEEGGWVVLDVFQPSLAFLGGTPEARRQVLRYQDPYRAREVRLFEENHYDPAAQLNSVRWSFESDGEEPERDELTMRLVFPQELEALVELGGLRLVHKWGDYARGPFTGTSQKQLVALTRA